MSDSVKRILISIVAISITGLIVAFVFDTFSKFNQKAQNVGTAVEQREKDIEDQEIMWIDGKTVTGVQAVNYIVQNRPYFTTVKYGSTVISNIDVFSTPGNSYFINSKYKSISVTISEDKKTITFNLISG